MFRVSQRGEGIDDAETIDGAREIVRGQPRGRYDVDEIRAERFPSGHTSRLWGRMIRDPDGWVEEVPWPWDRESSRERPRRWETVSGVRNRAWLRLNEAPPRSVSTGA